MTTALYRRYRPETFAEVVGQDHVTAPLRQALRSGQTNHAYLFSGPRGCGKTTSARILARCLNCAEGPTDTPCGRCASCVELARGGPGSLDVVEIDAASHGGVDDARDLRERATFAPARDRYKVFILDEAHMVSPQGFNALLKIVEEPPEHVKFIFATTEPDKVIGTIRSRTHHYPFRLVPPDVMVGYLEQLCTAEGVQVGSGVLPLVVRAGGGSVRDSLSVLDQLIAGSGPEGLGYEDAVALLGYTHASLLDDLVEAVAARDGASAFRVVERVISTGHEPRRFVEDLLERLRDLIVLAASGDAAAAVLRDVPGDQMTRMQTQARQLGAAELSRSADLVNAALSEMTGATSPRLHLELLMARLLLPALDDTAAGIGARLDRLEREGVRGATGGTAPAAAAAVTPAPPVPAPATPVERVAVVTPAVAAPAVSTPAVAAPAPPVPPAPVAADEPELAEPGSPEPGLVAPAPEHAPEAGEPDAEPVDDAEPAAAAPAPVAPSEPTEPVVAPHDVPTAEPQATVERPGGTPGGGDTEVLRRRWPEVLETLGRLKKTTWVLISQNAQVVELDATTLKLGFAAPGLASAFRGGSHADLVQQAVRETLGFTVKVEPVLVGQGADASAAPRGGAPTAPAARTGAPSAAEAAASWDAPAARPTPVPSSTAEAARAPQGGSGPGAAVAVDASPDEDPEAAVDPWSTAEVVGVVAPARRPDAPAAPTDAGPDASAPGTSTSGASTDPAPGRPGSPARGAADPAPAARATSAVPPPWDVPEGDVPGAPEPPPDDDWAAVEPPTPDGPPEPAGGASRSGAGPAARPSGADRVRAAARAGASAAPSAPARNRWADDEPSMDDPDIGANGLAGVPLVVQMLSATVVEELVDEGF
ncbi:DNA polymerase III subunit gamma and tau [Cellulomonas sp. NPDC058312]|uniref:DNA polymerase III subunit gamma and tau n=1 Tax=Cellulomonas sp. NPDC058312 TaxID=3346441 RepID=UPI0036F17330